MKKIILIILLMAMPAVAQFASSVPRSYIDHADSAKADTIWVWDILNDSFAVYIRSGDTISVATHALYADSAGTVTNIVSAKIVDQTIVKTDMDSSSGFTFLNIFKGTGAVPDSEFANHAYVKEIVSDSIATVMDLKEALDSVGAYIETTTADTIPVANKAVLADSAAVTSPITSAKITDQTIVKADIDTTGSNIPFDGAFHITTAVPESAYASQRTVSRGDSAQADTATTITAGNGLTGGGNLAANRTINIVGGAGINIYNDSINATLGTSIDSSEVVAGDAGIRRGVIDSTKLVSTPLSALRNNSVDSNKIVNGTIINANIKNATIDSVKQVAGVAGQRNNSIDSTKIVDGSISGADIKGDAVDSTKIKDGTVIGADIKASTIDSSKMAAGAAALRVNSVDSNKVAADNLAPSDINWAYEWLQFTQVYGWNHALEDQIYLNDNVMSGDTAFLVIDSAGAISANDADTFSIVGSIPYDCTIDSIQLMAYAYGSTVMDTIDFLGPDTITGTNIANHLYFSSGTNLGGALSVRKYVIGTPVHAISGSRFRLKIIVVFANASDVVRICWLRVRIKR